MQNDFHTSHQECFEFPRGQLARALAEAELGKWMRSTVRRTDHAQSYCCERDHLKGRSYSNAKIEANIGRALEPKAFH